MEVGGHLDRGVDPAARPVRPAQGPPHRASTRRARARSPCAARAAVPRRAGRAPSSAPSRGTRRTAPAGPAGDLSTARDPAQDAATASEPSTRRRACRRPGSGCRLVRRCTPARRAISAIDVAAGPDDRCRSTVASTIRRRVSSTCSARCFGSYLRVISLYTTCIDLVLIALYAMYSERSGRP